MCNIIICNSQIYLNKYMVSYVPNILRYKGVGKIYILLILYNRKFNNINYKFIVLDKII